MTSVAFAATLVLGLLPTAGYGPTVASLSTVHQTLQPAQPVAAPDSLYGKRTRVDLLWVDSQERLLYGMDLSSKEAVNFVRTGQAGKAVVFRTPLYWVPPGGALEEIPEGHRPLGVAYDGERLFVSFDSRALVVWKREAFPRPEGVFVLPRVARALDVDASTLSYVTGADNKVYLIDKRKLVAGSWFSPVAEDRVATVQRPEGLPSLEYKVSGIGIRIPARLWDRTRFGDFLVASSSLRALSLVDSSGRVRSEAPALTISATVTEPPDAVAPVGVEGGVLARSGKTLYSMKLSWHALRFVKLFEEWRREGNARTCFPMGEFGLLGDQASVLRVTFDLDDRIGLTFWTSFYDYMVFDPLVAARATGPHFMRLTDWQLRFVSGMDVLVQPLSQRFDVGTVTCREVPGDHARSGLTLSDDSMLIRSPAAGWQRVWADAGQGVGSFVLKGYALHGLAPPIPGYHVTEHFGAVSIWDQYFADKNAATKAVWFNQLLFTERPGSRFTLPSPDPQDIDSPPEANMPDKGYVVADVAIDRTYPVQVLFGNIAVDRTRGATPLFRSDIPLVLGKDTAVRVHLQLRGLMDWLEGVRVTLCWGGGACIPGLLSVDATLVRVDQLPFIPRGHESLLGKTFAITTAEAPGPFSKTARTPIDTTAAVTRFVRAIGEQGIEAVSFDGRRMGGAPLRPPSTGPFSSDISVAVVSGIHRLAEFDEANNVASFDATVKLSRFSVQNPLKILFQRVVMAPDPRNLAGTLFQFSWEGNNDTFRANVAARVRFLQAAYPLPTDAIKYDTLLDPLHATSGLAGPFATSSVGWMQRTLNAQLGECARLNYTRCVYVFPNFPDLAPETPGLANGLCFSAADKAVYRPLIIGPRERLLFPVCTVLVKEEANPADVELHGTTAHEIGHTYLGRHDPNGSLADDGWFVGHPTKPGRIRTSLETYFSLMEPKQFPLWLSRWNYETLGKWLVSESWVQDPKLLFVSGLLFANDTIRLDPFFTYLGVPFDPLGGNYRVELLAANGTVLQKVDFDPFFFEDEGVRVGTFGFAMLFPEEAQRMVIKREGRVLHEFGRSVSPPRVTLQVRELAGGQLAIRVNATHPDERPLTLWVDYSADGASWLPLARFTGVGAFEHHLTTADFPGGDQARVRVMATDGLNTVEAFSAPFAVTGTRPFVEISHPVDGSVWATGAPVIFQASGFVPQLPDEAFVWVSSIDGRLGQGRTVVSSTLSPGMHVVTMRVTDTRGQVAERHVTIAVRPDPKPNLSVRAVRFSTSPLAVNQTVTISVDIFNVASELVADVAFYDGTAGQATRLAEKRGLLFPANRFTLVTAQARFTAAGTHVVRVVVANATITETDAADNAASASVLVVASRAPPTLLTLPVMWQNHSFVLAVLTNASLRSYAFDQPGKALELTVRGATGTTGFANITFPQAMLAGQIRVTLDGQAAAFTLRGNATHLAVYVVFAAGDHILRIMGTMVIPEFPHYGLLLLLTIAIGAGLLLTRARRGRGTGARERMRRV